MVHFDGHTLTYEEGVEHGERTAQGLTKDEVRRSVVMWAQTTNPTEFSRGIAEGLLRGDYRDC